MHGQRYSEAVGARQERKWRLEREGMRTCARVGHHLMRFTM